jgi:hypothetical protein
MSKHCLILVTGFTLFTNNHPQTQRTEEREAEERRGFT